MFRFILILLFFISLISACRQSELYEKRNVLPKSTWDLQKPVKGTIQVTDTLAYYNLFVCIRHTDAYAYNNIWVRLKMACGKDSLLDTRLDLSLGTDADGWEGSGMNDIWDVCKKIRGPFRLPKKGDYHYELGQCMRENTLKGIMSAGIRMEKVK
jgi:gliding motility-associated lipoprotein GldH